MLDLVGQRFGRLRVQKFTNVRGGHSYWDCVCECGASKEARGGHLKGGNIKSCGCLHKELTIKRQTTHGQSIGGIVTRTYESWSDMKQRGNNPQCKKFKNYGAIGRTVCDRWLESFDNFFEDMGERPEGMTLERIDNTKGYYKENCRWATCKEQQNNRRDNVWYEYGGERKTITQWAESLHMNMGTLWGRLRKYNWSIERALNTPIKKCGPKSSNA